MFSWWLFNRLKIFLKKPLTPTRESVEYASQANDLASNGCICKTMQRSLTIQNKKSVWTLTGVELFEIAS
ncbi:hypothetical protein, partial [Shewanella benthica]|uniref:hypothetical protein n=1 Tax=Shewanella benthica TaxID=43661 RepID=UPI001D0D7A8B